MKYLKLILITLLLGTVFSCNTIEEENNKIFQLVPSSDSNVDFINKLEETEEINYFTYPYMYLGGGVAVGDVNGDSLPDIFFTGNMVSNRLYINQGEMNFKDISEKAGVLGDNRWMTGATMADVNADGRLDIYVSVSGKFTTTENLLYINMGNDENGDPRFEEQAKQYGVADSGHSTQGTFFDYDLDGDLDLYVANYPYTDFSEPNAYYRNALDESKHEDSGHLYKNENGKFVDVTKESGVQKFGLSLSATVGDIDQNGYPDIYVSNDFACPDFLFFNNGDGTFTEKSSLVFAHTSFYGMGADVADFNNDGLLDIAQMDMTPENNRRSKANMASMNPQNFSNMIDLGLQHQYMKNSLQLNNGISDKGYPIFSDIAYLAGIANTDWSWASLFVDLDNDGFKDLFITNGIKRDINNKDYFNNLAFKNENYLGTKKQSSLLEDVKKMPSEPIDNYIFRNKSNLSFEKVNEKWGLSFKGFSNGAVYADLDNDGDMDLIINNIDDVASIFKNTTSDKSLANYIQFRFEGTGKNLQGLGVKVSIEAQGKKQFAELTTTRGFQSSVQPILHFGLGKNLKVDKVKIQWPNGESQELNNLKANQTLTIKQKAATRTQKPNAKAKPYLFQDVTSKSGIDFKHNENDYDDYLREVLLPHQTSKLGPALAVADINNDGLDDFYIGGAAGQLGAVFIQTKAGRFKKSDSNFLKEDIEKEDVGAVFFDCDNDKDQDLYIVSGGNEFIDNKTKHQLKDRLYINDGKGNFIKSPNALPNLYNSGSCVKPFDYDQDGDLDLFVGSRLIPANYPLPASSIILENQFNKTGKIKFVDVTKRVAPELLNLGLVTDASWVDIDQNGKTDLVVVGEWMPVTTFLYDGVRFKNTTQKSGLGHTTGWWSSVASGDFDNDGDIDLVAGNLGLNYKYQATDKESFDVYSGDFDGNGINDVVLAYYNEGSLFPVRGKQCSSQGIRSVKYKFETYDQFASSNLEQVYSKPALKKALHIKAKTFASTYFENTGNGKFIRHVLPNLAQVSSINGIVVDDYNKDGNLDILTAGNFYVSEVETPRNDASIGLLIYGDGHGNFSPVQAADSGLYSRFDTRQVRAIKTQNGKGILLANNNQQVNLLIMKSGD